jgi:hypothetical protein
MLWIVRSQSFPVLGRMFMARPHRRALAFLGFWVRQAPCDTPRIRTVVDHLALPNRVAPRTDRCGLVWACELLPESSGSAPEWCGLWAMGRYVRHRTLQTQFTPARQCGYLKQALLARVHVVKGHVARSA